MDQLRSLRVLVKVVDEGSFAAASRALDLAPAIVTRAVAELEQHLGVRLLNRTTRRLALTEIGEAYVERARQILIDTDEANALASTSAAEPSGHLRVLAPPAFTVHQLAKHLPAFRARYPKVSLELMVAGPVGAVDENYDVSILSIGQQGLQGEFIARRLACSHFVACASPAYLKQRGRPKEPQDLSRHEGMWPAVRSVRRELTLYRVAESSEAATENRVTIANPTAALSTIHIETLYAAALAGLGIAGLPSFVVEDALREGALERVLPQWRGITLTLYAAMPTRKHVPARTRVLIDYLLEIFGGKEDDPWMRPLKRGVK
jgi:DNA-binding transcriptional LysR family regulator